jgi:hypothetical protein
MCSHDWQPIDGWCARYRCAPCNVIGCKLGVVEPWRRTGMAIEPYRCESPCGGEPCDQPAVHRSRSKGFRCEAHRPGQAARARRELASAEKAASTPAAAAVDASTRTTARI